MKTPALIICCILLVTLSACKKDRNDPSTRSGSNPTSYLLKKQTYEHAYATNGDSFLYEYNADNQVSQMKRIQWGTVLSPPGKWYDTTTYSFEYNNNLPIRCTIKQMGGTWYYDYTYKGNQITQKTIKYANQNIQGYSLYTYDSDNKLVEVVDSTDKVNFRHLFEYNNNLTAVTTYTLWRNPQKKSKKEYANFDTRVNYIRAVNGLPVVWSWDSFNTGAYSSSSPNNYGLEKHFLDVDINATFGPPTTMNYSYEYNEEGLPVKMQYSGWTVLFEYEKYK